MAIQLEKCCSCHTPVRWVVTVKTEKGGGVTMPLDPDMTPDGNFVFTLERNVEGGKEPVEDGPVRALRKDELEGPATRPRYKSHFATCPQSRTWRKGVTQKAVEKIREKHGQP